MPSVTVDFSELPEKEVLPNGAYNVRVDKVTLRESNSSEHPYLNWRLKVIDEPYEGETLWYRTSLHPNALPMLQNQFIRIGLVENEGEKITFDIDEEGAVLTPELEGRVLLADVSIGQYRGKKQNSVDMLSIPKNEVTKADGTPVKGLR